MNDKTTKSKAVMESSRVVIPGGVNSPVRAFLSVGGTPRVVKRAEGPFLFDIDGNRYLDFCCSWGPLILGHAYPDVVAAVTEQVRHGMTYGAATEVEYRLARFITDRIPHVEKIRFVSSGTEAVMSALRLARGFTGRELILKFEGCYHGHGDQLLVQAGSGLATLGLPSSQGVPSAVTSSTAVLPLDDERLVREFFARHGDRLAAVIIEGVPANNGLLIQRREFMQLLRSLTTDCGALLILDEVITGFRLGFGGAATFYDLTPDLVTYGKIIGGGMPVGAFGGRADIMDCVSPLGPVYQAGTLSGNPVAMTAGLATLEHLANDDFYRDLERKTGSFVSALNSPLAEDGRVSVISLSSIFWLVFQSDPPRAAHQIEADGIQRFNSCHHRWLAAGLYLPPSGYEVCFVSAAHSEDLLQEAAGQMAAVILGGTP